MFRRIANWFRKKLNKPIKFDYAKAMAEAQAEADAELSRLTDPGVLSEVESWSDVSDPLTDGIECGTHEHNASN